MWEDEAEAMVIKRGGGSPEASGAALVALARRLGEGVDWDAIARIVDAGDERLSSSRLTAEAAAHAEASASGASIEQGTPCPVCCRQTKGVAACFAQGHLFRTAGGGLPSSCKDCKQRNKGALFCFKRGHMPELVAVVHPAGLSPAGGAQPPAPAGECQV